MEEISRKGWVVIVKAVVLGLVVLGCQAEDSRRELEPDHEGEDETAQEVDTSERPASCVNDRPYRPFVFVQKVGAGEQVTLPLPEGLSYGFAINWGDESATEKDGYPFVDSADSAEATHTYVSAGEYTVSIYGMVEAWSYKQFPEQPCLITEITDLGDTGWKNFAGAFAGCQNLKAVKGGEISQVVDMSSMFANADGVLLDVSSWDFAVVADMGGMFSEVSLATEVYSDLLNRIVQTTTLRGVPLDGGNSQYNAAAAISRTKLNNADWKIEDGGEA